MRGVRGRSVGCQGRGPTDKRARPGQRGRKHMRALQTTLAVSPYLASIYDWSRRDSNPRPPGCKPGALPTELRPRGSRRTRVVRRSAIGWWRLRPAQPDRFGPHPPPRRMMSMAITPPINAAIMTCGQSMSILTFRGNFRLLQARHWAHQDLNLGLHRYQRCALPTEL